MSTSTPRSRTSSKKRRQRQRTARIPIRPSSYWGHAPSVKQAAFLSLPHLEAFYGGAAGGGKSDALLMAALQYADVPGYKALLLRKTFADLAQADGLLDRSHEWLSGRAAWNEQKHRWTFPSGAILEFGHMQYSKDRYSYQGAAYDFVGFDELSHFDKPEYIYLFSRIGRDADSPVPTRMRSASNPPPNPQNHWITLRFIEKVPDPDDPGDTPEKCAQRIFIPALPGDNPGLDHEGYDANLAMLDPQSYRQLALGDWHARQPGNWVFDHEHIDAVAELGRRFDEHVDVGTMPPPVGSAMATGMDYGDLATVCEPLWGLEAGGLYVPPGEVSTSREDLEAITMQVAEMMGNYPWWWAEHRYDASFAQSNRTLAAILQREKGIHNPMRRVGRPNTVPITFNKNKDPSVRYLRLLMKRTYLWVHDLPDDKGKKVDGTRVLAISPKARLLLRQMREAKLDDFGKIIKGDDDAMDALIAGASPLAQQNRATVDKGTAEAKRRGAAAAKKRLLPSQTN